MNNFNISTECIHLNLVLPPPFFPFIFSSKYYAIYVTISKTPFFHFLGQGFLLQILWTEQLQMAPGSQKLEVVLSNAEVEIGNNMKIIRFTKSDLEIRKLLKLRNFSRDSSQKASGAMSDFLFGIVRFQLHYDISFRGVIELWEVRNKVRNKKISFRRVFFNQYLIFIRLVTSLLFAATRP